MNGDETKDSVAKITLLSILVALVVGWSWLINFVARTYFGGK